MTKVGFFSDQVIYGGGESNLVRLARSMSTFCDVTIVAPSGELLRAAQENGINTVTLDRRSSRWIKGIPLYWGRERTMPRAFDVVHAYSLHILPMLLGHPKLFWTVHGPWEKPWGLRAKVIARYAARVIAVSNDVARKCEFPQDKLIVVPLGAVHDKDCALLPDQCLSLSHLPVVNIGVLGRIQRVKGQDLAIKSIIALAKRNPDRMFRLHLGGSVNQSNQEDVAYKNEIEKAALETNLIRNLSVVWHGFVSTPVSFIDDMDLMLISSRYESFSMVAVEALSRGKHVLAPDIGGPADIISDSSIGQKFEAGNTTSIIDALQFAISDLKYNPIDAINRAKKFTIEAQCAAHLRLYGLTNIS